MRLNQYDRAVKYLKHAYEHYKDDVEILYGYGLSIFKDYVAFKEQIPTLTHEPTRSASNPKNDI